jgi:hypothetical protein
VSLPTADIWIDFDGAHSIQLNGAGNSGKYLLRPTVFAYDRAVTGSISGTLTDGASGLPGATVMAEVLDGSGNPSVVRSTLTDGSGKYTLDLLPVGSAYYVVSLPVTGSGAGLKVFGPRASGPLALTASAPVQSFSAAFTADSALGAVSGTVTPLAGADQSDTIQVIGILGGQSFILGSTVAALGGSAETFSLANLPAGPYALVGVRTTTPAGSAPTVARAASVPVVVTAGTSAPAVVAF